MQDTKQVTLNDLENTTKESPVQHQIRAIEIAILHLQYVRWSYPKNKLFKNDTRYHNALLTLIKKFGIEHFTTALKEIFDHNLGALDIWNLEFGPHSDISPFGFAAVPVVENLIDHCHPIINTSEHGYLVNVKTAFGDPGLWKFLSENKIIPEKCYSDLIEHIRQWPHEYESNAIYNPNNTFNPSV